MASSIETKKLKALVNPLRRAARAHDDEQQDDQCQQQRYQVLTRKDSG
jgi:hypothetical protein